MVRLRNLALLTLLLLGVFTLSANGESCGKTIHRRDGSVVKLEYLHCPGLGDHSNAQFCCGNERRHHCCTAEDLRRHHRTNYVRPNESPGNMEIFGEQQTKDRNMNETPNAVHPNENSLSATGEKCGKTIHRSDGTVVRLDFIHCPDFGDGDDARYCCGNSWRPRCCTATQLGIREQIGESQRETEIADAQQSNYERLLKTLEEKTTELDKLLNAYKTNKNLISNMDIGPLTEVTPSATGEKCGITVHRPDGTVIELNSVQCPGSNEHKDALFCCPNEWQNRCCTAEDIRRNGKTDYVKIDETPDKIAAEQPQNGASINEPVTKKIISIPLTENKPTIVGENCGKNIYHSDGSIFQMDFRQCPESGDHKDALFCCGRAKRNRCCTAADILRHGKTDQSSTGTGPVSQPQPNTNGTPNGNIQSGEIEHKRREESHTCDDNHSILHLLRICSVSADSRNFKRCCKRRGDHSRYCCTEDEYQENIRGNLELEKAARRKDIVVKVLGASLLVLMSAVLLAWYCCVHANRKRGYQLVGVHEPLLKKSPSQYTLFYNVDKPSEQVRKHTYV